MTVNLNNILSCISVRSFHYNYKCFINFIIIITYISKMYCMTLYICKLNILF